MIDFLSTSNNLVINGDICERGLSLSDQTEKESHIVQSPTPKAMH